ncbi:MAG TPA: RNA methyltransferase [Planctomycetota bacterium]
MEAQPVQSARNPRLKAVRAVRAGRDHEHLLLEGPHLLVEALAAGAKVDWLLHGDDLPPDAHDGLLELARARGIETVPCPESLLDAVSDLDSQRGLLAFGPRPLGDLDTLLDRTAQDAGLVLVAAGVQEPGNVGAIARVAAGLGASGLVTLHGGASAWHARALRGASGTTFRVPVADRVGIEELIAGCARAGVALWSTAADGEDLRGLRRESAVALVLGEEGGGVPALLRAASARTLGIPLQRGVESLNVATAAAVLTWALGGDLA